MDLGKTIAPGTDRLTLNEFMTQGAKSATRFYRKGDFFRDLL